MSRNPFKRDRVDRVHFPPLEEALARPAGRHVEAAGREVGTGHGEAEWDNDDEDDDKEEDENEDEDEDEDDVGHPDGRVNWSIDQLAALYPADIEEPGSESETLPTPKRARQQAAMDSSEATPARDEGEDIALFARLGARLRSPVPGHTPTPTPRGGPEQLWSPIAGSGPSAASNARGNEAITSSPTLGTLLLSTPAPVVTSSPTLGPLLVSTPAPSSSQPAGVAWSPSPLHLPPLTSDDGLSQGGPGSSPGARRAPRSGGGGRRR